MPKGLIIYGDQAVGKSTLELNLRRFYFGNPLTQEPFQYDGKRCFLGKTAKRHDRIMSTGGAESLLEIPELPPAEWFIASIPIRGRDGTQLSLDFMSQLEECYAICLYTDKRGEYRRKRVRFFSGRESTAKDTPAKVKFPPFLQREQCYPYRTEQALEASRFAIELLGSDRMNLNVLRELDYIMSIEEIGTEPAFVVEGICFNCGGPFNEGCCLAG